MSDLFSENLIIMNRLVQQGPAGLTNTWGDGPVITAKLQISNMQDVLIAQAQGVIPTGYLVIDKKYEPFVEINTYLKWPKGGLYVRVTDIGAVEAGEGFFDERQFAVEAMQSLPRM